MDVRGTIFSMSVDELGSCLTFLFSRWERGARARAHMPTACATCSRVWFVEEGGSCKGCNLLRKLGQELRFQPHSKLEARIAISWLESALRGLEVLRDSSHFQSEDSRSNLGLKTCPQPPSSLARGSADSGTVHSRASGETQRDSDEVRREAAGEEVRGGAAVERPRRERRREREDRERDGKRRRRG